MVLPYGLKPATGFVASGASWEGPGAGQDQLLVVLSPEPPGRSYKVSVLHLGDTWERLCYQSRLFSTMVSGLLNKRHRAC